MVKDLEEYFVDEEGISKYLNLKKLSDMMKNTLRDSPTARICLNFRSNTNSLKWNKLASLVDLRAALGTRSPPPPPPVSKFFHFHAVFGKNWANNRLASPLLGLAPPPPPLVLFYWSFHHVQYLCMDAKNKILLTLFGICRWDRTTGFCAGAIFVIFGIVISTVVNFNNTKDFQRAKCRTVSKNVLI